MQDAANESLGRAFVAVAPGGGAGARVSPSPTPSGGPTKRKENPAGFDPASADSRASVPKKAKSFDEVHEEVRLKTYMLVSTDEAAKLRALTELAECISGKATPQKEEYSCAIGEWGVCHFVLIVLHHELAKNDESNRAVVFSAIRFLTNWMKGAKQRDDASSCKGSGIIVDAMKAYPNDKEIQNATACWFLNYSSDKDETRLREIVDVDGVSRIVHVMRTFLKDKGMVKVCVKILDRLCDAASHERRLHLVRVGVPIVLAMAIEAYLESDAHIHAYGKKVMAKLCQPPSAA